MVRLYIDAKLEYKLDALNLIDLIFQHYEMLQVEDG